MNIWRDRVILGFSSRHMGHFLLLMIMMTNGPACWAPEKWRLTNPLWGLLHQISFLSIPCSQMVLTGCADRNIAYCKRLWELNPIGSFMVSLAYKDEWAAMIRYRRPPESSQVSAAIEKKSSVETHSLIVMWWVRFRIHTVWPIESFDMHVNLATKNINRNKDCRNINGFRHFNTTVTPVRLFLNGALLR